jgi:hypothetical protein
MSALLTNAAGDASGFQSNDRSNLSALMAQLAITPSYYDQIAASYGRPAQAAAFAGSLPAKTLADYISDAKNNFLGFEQKHSAGVTETINSTIAEIVKLYTAYMTGGASMAMDSGGGGGGGGGMGGIMSMFGGGGGGTPKQSWIGASGPSQMQTASSGNYPGGPSTGASWGNFLYE